MAKVRTDMTRTEMRDALLRSGYLLEARVEAILRQAWGCAQANATYLDPLTAKAREYDLFAMNATRAGPNEQDYIFGVFVAECINNPQPLVILTREPEVAFLHRGHLRFSGLPVKVPDKSRLGGWRPLADYLMLEKCLHYCRGPVGTQFCSFAQKKSGSANEWMATHEGSHFESFNKLCHVVEYLADRHYKSWVSGSREWVNIQVYYPVVVLQGDLLEAQQTSRSVRLRTADHLQLHRPSIIEGREVDFQIDVIRERFLPKYLDLIEKELEAIAERLRRRQRKIRAAIETILEKAREQKSKGLVREAMDYLEGI